MRPTAVLLPLIRFSPPYFLANTAFPTLMQANEFARRYVRDSIEHCRVPGMSPLSSGQPGTDLTPSHTSSAGFCAPALARGWSKRAGLRVRR